MRSIFRRTASYDPVELLDSKLFNEVGFYQAFTDDLKHALHDVIIESPFLAVKRTQSMLPLFESLINCGVKVRIDTRHQRYHERELQMQAWQSLNRLKAIGVRVKFYDDMRHRKVAIIDDLVLWEGS